MQKIIARPGAWAFWKYDLFPYMLGGQIKEPENDRKWHSGESVFISSYGHYFKPVFCLDEVEGPVMMNTISELRKLHKQQSDALTREMAEHRRRSVLGQLDKR